MTVVAEKKYTLDTRQVGRRIREVRQVRNLTQRQLAFPGCTYAYISRVENGERTPSLGALITLAERLDVSPLWLATGDLGVCPLCQR